MSWRTVFLVGALLVLPGGWMVRAAPDSAVLVGQVTSDNDDYGEGYFSIGDQTVIATRPGSPLHSWLRSHQGQRVQIVAQPEAAGQ